MQRFIFFLVFIILFFISGARANDLYLNCKFENGTSYSKGVKIEPIYKGEKGTEDINIILDIKRKKIIEAHGYNNEKKEDKKYNYYGHETIQSSKWSENEIEWSSLGETQSTEYKHNAFYNLNRRSGVLKILNIIKIKNAEGRLELQYSCSKQDKKF